MPTVESWAAAFIESVDVLGERTGEADARTRYRPKAVGDTCPEDLSKIQDAAKAAAPLGSASRALAICSDRPQFSGKVLSIGMWSDDGGDSDAQLESALIAASPLIPGSSAALMFTSDAIQFMASLDWEKKPKKIDAKVGFIRLGGQYPRRGPRKRSNCYHGTWRI